MTQPSRTTESLNRDNEAIRDLMHQIQDRLTVPDRATLTLGLVGHLATLMNHSQMDKLMTQLTDEAARVQDVPPTRRREAAAGREDERGMSATGRGARQDVGQAGRGPVTEDRGRLL